jgi:hypothetical protein
MSSHDGREEKTKKKSEMLKLDIIGWCYKKYFNKMNSTILKKISEWTKLFFKDK